MAQDFGAIACPPTNQKPFALDVNGIQKAMSLLCKVFYGNWGLRRPPQAERVCQRVFGTEISSQAISNLVAQLDAEVAAFHRRVVHHL